MKHWWERNINVDLEGYTKDEVEDLIGYIPLLLDNSLVNGKIDLFANALKSVFKEVQEFISNIERTTTQNGDTVGWEKYVALYQLILGYR